jgi:hypothetical protein
LAVSFLRIAFFPFPFLVSATMQTGCCLSSA